MTGFRGLYWSWLTFLDHRVHRNKAEPTYVGRRYGVAASGTFASISRDCRWSRACISEKSFTQKLVGAFSQSVLRVAIHQLHIMQRHFCSGVT